MGGRRRAYTVDGEAPRFAVATAADGASPPIDVEEDDDRDDHSIGGTQQVPRGDESINGLLRSVSQQSGSRSSDSGGGSSFTDDITSASIQALDDEVESRASALLARVSRMRGMFEQVHGAALRIGTSSVRGTQSQDTTRPADSTRGRLSSPARRISRFSVGTTGDRDEHTGGHSGDNDTRVLPPLRIAGRGAGATGAATTSLDDADLASYQSGDGAKPLQGTRTLGRGNTISFGGIQTGSNAGGFGKHQVIGTLSRKFAYHTLKGSLKDVASSSASPGKYSTLSRIPAAMLRDESTASDGRGTKGDTATSGAALRANLQQMQQQRIQELTTENTALSQLLKEYENTMALMVSRVTEQLMAAHAEKTAEIAVLEDKIRREMEASSALRYQNVILQTELARSVDTMKRALNAEDPRDDELTRIRAENAVLRQMLGREP